MLEKDGYTYRPETNDWEAPDGEIIEDEYVEQHHSKLAAKVLYERLRGYIR